MRVFSASADFSRVAIQAGLSHAPLERLGAEQPDSAHLQLAGCAVTIGNFDGVHIGHRELLRQTRILASETSGKSVVVTFEPHPASFFRPQQAAPLINTPCQKLTLLAEAGIEVAAVLSFDHALAVMTAEEFVHEWLAQRLGARHVVVGSGFVFGKDRVGDVPLLKELGSNLSFDVHPVLPVTLGEQIVSSSHVRALVGEGAMEQVERLLLRPFALQGKVVRGAGRGSKIGIPTANLAPDNELLPAPGVYAGVARPKGATSYHAAVNIGRAPTFYQDCELKVEAHLLGYQGDLVGQRMELQLVSRLREERTFERVEALVEQIHRDIDRAARLLSARATDGHG